VRSPARTLEQRQYTGYVTCPSSFSRKSGSSTYTTVQDHQDGQQGNLKTTAKARPSRFLAVLLRRHRHHPAVNAAVDGVTVKYQRK